MLLPSSRLSNVHLFAQEVIAEIFKVSLLLYLFFFLIEYFKSGFISVFFNMNVLLGIILISGFLAMVDAPTHDNPTPQPLGKRGIFMAAAIMVVTALVTYYSVRSLGKFTLVIVPLVSIVSVLIGWLFLTSDDTKKTD